MTIRILVVDDSVVIRKLLTATLNEAPGMQVVATAALGKIALAKISQCNPDIVILDVEMPEMDGIETLRRIRKEAPLLPVIMFSTKTDRGAAATIEALTCGASDYVTKPSNAGNVLNAMARVREEMVPKIQALAGRARPTLIRPATSPFAIPLIRTTTSPLATSSVKTTTVQPFATTRITTMSGSATLPIATLLAATPPMVKPTTQVSSRARPTTAAPIAARDGTVRMRRPTGGRPPVAIVAIGASTGGPNALSVLLAQLPADFPVPIVIVQHMLATFTQHFADRLASQCRIKIIEATAGDALEAGHAYIARGDHHLLVERRMGRAGLAMNQDAVENFCRPAVDVLFRSVAQIYGTSALAVVLTGMGHDGLLGCGAIRESGGDVIVQDEASSVVWGMPGFVARAGLASQVLPLDQLGSEIQRRVAFGIARAVGGDAVTIDASGFNFVRQLVRDRAAIILEDGKQYLVDNRLSQLARREGLVSAQDVIDRLRAAPGGPWQRKVIEAMTTTETLFFRDSKPYEALRKTIIPELVRLRASERRLQIWSAACSSGQEPYSIAMMVREHFPVVHAWDVRMLATDISTAMLARSRAGRYSQLEVNRGLPAAYLLKYFDKVELDWQIRSELRKMIEFRELNLAGPWSAMPPTDLVMLRNVLIYFDVETKRQILGKIRKILRPGGFLLLGTAETTMNLDDGFELTRSDGTTYYRTRGP